MKKINYINPQLHVELHQLDTVPS